MSRWTEIPAARSSAAMLKVKLYLVLGFLAAATLSGIFATFAWMGADKAQPPVPVEYAQATAEATTVAEQWVAGGPITVQLAAGLGKDTIVTGGKPLASVTRIAHEGFSVVRAGDREVEEHRFLLSGNDKQLLWILTVPIQRTGLTGVLVAAPSLSPALQLATPPSRFDWTDVPGQQTKSAQLERIVESWGKAYLSNDSAALLQLTGDPKVQTYIGITGFELTNSTVRSLVGRGDNASWSVARVELKTRTKDGFQGLMEFDLLITDAGTGTPKIVAWGPPGSGGSLAPYQNALIGS